MPSITINIPIIPKPQKRDRISARSGFARSYKAKEQLKEEDNLRALIYRELPKHVLWPLQTAIALTLSIGLPIPKSASKREIRAILGGEKRHTKKPDADNLLKHIKDVATGVIWQDDRQVDEIHVRKFYSETPGWEVHIEW